MPPRKKTETPPVEQPKVDTAADTPPAENPPADNVSAGDDTVDVDSGPDILADDDAFDLWIRQTRSRCTFEDRMHRLASYPVRPGRITAVWLDAPPGS